MAEIRKGESSSNAVPNRNKQDEVYDELKSIIDCQAYVK